MLRGVDVATAMKPQRTLRSMLVKKRPAPAQVLGSVDKFTCGFFSRCYVGETSRPVLERIKEHKRAVRELDVDRSEPARHFAETGHVPNFEDVTTLAKEGFWRRRVIKEAL